MNIVFISPHFPNNFYHFCVSLKKLGANVLAIADVEYENIRKELKQSLTEYYKVKDLENYEQVLKACGFFTHKYGKIDRIISQNEYWLETEAKLRTDFNVFGPKINFVEKYKKKSEMKKAFLEAKVNCAKGELVKDLKSSLKFIKKVGYPIVLKPDVGVGAAGTYKIKNENDLNNFFKNKPEINYYQEEFISGKLMSFDGVVDKNGKVVFETVHEYDEGIMEILNQDNLLSYYSLIKIPKDIQETGKKLIKKFNLKESFFHFEFFRKNDKSLKVLEVNLRAPGGWTLDLINYANDINIYYQWANIVINNNFSDNISRKYHAAYIGRKYNRKYQVKHEDILSKFDNKIINHQPVSEIFQKILGNYGYVIRSESLDEIKQIIKYIKN